MLLASPTITVQGIRNDDQSLSPVTSLVSLLFLSFLIPRNVQEHVLFTSIILTLYVCFGYSVPPKMRNMTYSYPLISCISTIVV